MRNIFLVYMPPGNAEAMVHYEDTIKQRVPLSRLRPYLSRSESLRLEDIFGVRPIAVWGSRDSDRNRATFDRMRPGDDVLIVEGPTIRFVGKIAAKRVDPALSRELWKQLRPASVEGWDLIYFIANPLEIEIPFQLFGNLVGFAGGFQLRGFTALSADRIESFYSKYDDLYSVLLSLAKGRDVREKEARDPAIADSIPLVDPAAEDMEPIAAKAISEHVRMQWKLATLGVKAGEKVWVPPGDRTRIQSAYQFDQFEDKFADGIDLQSNYFQNIDVVWKEEFRINAAFEVENSTAIYSGLLRFADLNVVAPNTAYPMFIVAPQERRNRVREQLMRPAFRRLDLRDKVKFLPYEAVDEIDRFFEAASSGLSVDLISGKAESLL
ncbi:MAG TPA: hypothetical protein VE967_14870 [Gemmatimonadaceae bacterium]|nr:hypothetical protein [Gemmatimonadaceae bacterium]